jgi:type VI protein secretion system component VasK
MDQIVGYLFPNKEWELSLGWLNIRAERRARAWLRVIRLGLYLLLLGALGGIVLAAHGFPKLADWSDPWVMGELVLRVPALALCLLIWVAYLGLVLLPRLRTEHEEVEYQKFRADMAELEEEEQTETQPTSRIHHPLRKPRVNPKPVILTPKRAVNWNQPGG